MVFRIFPVQGGHVCVAGATESPMAVSFGIAKERRREGKSGHAQDP